MDVSTEWLDWYIDEALREDVGSGDHSSMACIPKDDRSTAYLLVKDTGILAGIEFAQYVWSKKAPHATLTWNLKDGDRVKYGDIAFELEGDTRTILKLERFVLNTMQRMSGIATLSNKFAEKVADLDVTILDTRKTTPLLRNIEKWAVKIGGCSNYRHGLYDWIMIKDNHITAAGNVSKAIERVLEYLKAKELDLDITVEVRNREEAMAVLSKGGIRRIMFDNFDPLELREAVAFVGGQFETEASGGITLETVREYAETGVEFISAGALTHSFESMDLSLKIR